MADLLITSLRGGLNVTDPPTQLPQDQCVAATNVEFFRSTLGEKRNGCDAVDLGTSNPFDDPLLTADTFLFRHLPNSDQHDAELWTLIQSMNSADYALMRKTTAWTEVVPLDAIDVSGNYGLLLNAVSFHNKMFISYKSAKDRLHCWDGTTLRRVGLAEPPGGAPSVTNTGSGSYQGKRYFRVRAAVYVGSVLTLLSEPTDATAFSPSGSGSAARITKPTMPGEGETHWLVEASLNNVDFYVIQSVVIGTTTYDDSTVYAAGYRIGNVLSPEIGDFEVPESCEFLIADQDRLIMAGAFEDLTHTSRVSWTPVSNDPGFGDNPVGNDERVPIDTDNFLDLDPEDGGGITGMSKPEAGTFVVFKFSGVYIFQRTGQRTQAYQQYCVTKQRGALKGSVVNGGDSAGRPCVYFLDPVVGPCQVDYQGVIRVCSWDVLKIWNEEVNTQADKPCHGVYYPTKRQVRWWIATDESETPNRVLNLQCTEMQEQGDGLRRGWSQFDGYQADALCSCLFSTNIDDDDARNFTLAPFIGRQADGADRDFIQRCDTGTTDNGNLFSGLVQTRPFIWTNILDMAGVMVASIIAKASTGVTMFVTAISDFGKNDKTVSTSLTPVGTEGVSVVRVLDDFSLREGYVWSFAFGDNIDVESGWELEMFSVRHERDDQASGVGA